MAARRPGGSLGRREEAPQNEANEDSVGDELSSDVGWSADGSRGGSGATVAAAPATWGEIQSPSQDVAKGFASRGSKGELRPSAKGSPAQGEDELDALCPSLDSQAWDLLQERPAVPSTFVVAPNPEPPLEPNYDSGAGPWGRPQSQPSWGRSETVGSRQSASWPGMEDRRDRGRDGDRDGQWGGTRDRERGRGAGMSPPWDSTDKSTQFRNRRESGAAPWASPPPRQPAGAGPPLAAEGWVRREEGGSSTGQGGLRRREYPSVGSTSEVAALLDAGAPLTYQDMRQAHWKIKQTLYAFLHGRYECGEELSSADRSFVVEHALEFHPRKAEKIGTGVASIKVDIHPDFRDTKCFFIMTRDRDSWDDFSYLKCMEARYNLMLSKLEGPRAPPGSATGRRPWSPQDSAGHGTRGEQWDARGRLVARRSDVPRVQDRRVGPGGMEGGDGAQGLYRAWQERQSHAEQAQGESQRGAFWRAAQSKAVAPF